MDIDVGEKIRLFALLAEHCAEYMKRVVFPRAYLAKTFLHYPGK